MDAANASAESHLLLYFVAGEFPSKETPSSSSTKAATVEEMDPEVWSKMPEEILDRVMLVLPCASQLRFRVVSKSWQSRLTGHSFLQRSAALALPAPTVACAYEYRHGTRHGDDRSGPGKPMWRKTKCKAYRVDLSFLPPKIQQWRNRRHVANDGLICVGFSQKRRVFEGRKDRVETVELFCVFNPISRSFVLVPELVTDNQIATAMHVELDRPQDGFFKVVVVCGSVEGSGHSRKWTINTYSSRSGAWSSTPGSPAPVSYYTWCHSAFLGNLIYSFEVEQMMLLNREDGQLVKHGKVGRPVPDFEGTNFHLLDHQGTIYFAGETYHGTTDPWFLVWRLDEDKMGWVLVSQMPVWIHDKLVKPTRLNRLADCTFCIGDACVLGDHIYFTLGVQSIPTYGSWSQFGAAKVGSWSHIITYHIPDQTWDLAFEKISDLVCKRYADPSGFFVPNLARLR